ncbi:ankyrin repeat and SOCS box protein 10 [Rhinoderma darwinii]|uniref:ankyrin repeat and SOCS box protein 10 n=1 Tax=Rhinoderma darwinii TaxID=43563 RepID=UPI003F67048A
MSTVIVTRKADGTALHFWLSLLSGHADIVQKLLEKSHDLIRPDAVFDTSDMDEWRNYRYNTHALRIWSLTYEEEFTCPLYVTATRGYTECLQLLLNKGAEVDFAPGGESALHGACKNGHNECVRILLRHGANPNKQTQDGIFPLHLCKTPESYLCAKLLLQYGAHVNSQTEDEDLTPLHGAARHGLLGHVDLYLRYGAAVDKRDVQGETPLSVACSHPQTTDQLDCYYKVCQRLIDSGANIRTRDNDQQSPLHLACKSANPQTVALLLEQGAEVNAMSYSGNTAMQNILQVTSYKLQNQPELIVRALLNHGAIRVWPGALSKVLRYCCSSPRTVEVLLNTYSKLRGTEDWAEVVPEEEQQTSSDHHLVYETRDHRLICETPRDHHHMRHQDTLTLYMRHQETHYLTYEIPRGHHLTYEIPRNHHLKYETPRNHHLTCETPTNHHLTYEIPRNHHLTYETPRNHHLTCETPTNHHLTYEARRDHHLIYETPRDHHMIYEAPIDHYLI